MERVGYESLVLLSLLAVSTSEIYPYCYNGYRVSDYSSCGVKWSQKWSRGAIAAHVYPKQFRYSYGSKVKLRCGNKFFMTSTCGFNGSWSVPWIYCRDYKLVTCQLPPVYQSGASSLILHSPAHLPYLPFRHVYPIGTIIDFNCPGETYLWGNSSSTCTFCGWNKRFPMCVSFDMFKSLCARHGRTEFRKKDNREVPYCYKEPVELHTTDGQYSDSNNVTTIVTATAETLFAILLLVCIVVIFQKYRQNRYVRRLNEMTAINTTPDLDIPGIHFVLPSYDEAVRSKPTTDPPTFEETMQADNASLQDTTSGVNNVSDRLTLLNHNAELDFSIGENIINSDVLSLIQEEDDDDVDQLEGATSTTFYLGFD